MRRVRTATERYMYTYDLKGVYYQIRSGDKVAIQFGSRCITGIVQNVGTKYVVIQVGAKINYNPKMCGRVFEIPIQKVALADIKRIVRYPSGSQVYGERNLR